MKSTRLVGFAAALAIAGVVVWLLVNRPVAPDVPLTTETAGPTPEPHSLVPAASPGSQALPVRPQPSAPAAPELADRPTTLRNAPGRAAPSAQPPLPKARPPGAPEIAPPAPVSGPSLAQARFEIDSVRTMMRDFRSIAGENPEGTNKEIMTALMGENKKSARLGPPEGMKLNANGELVDGWGTPFFFHQLSRLEMEVRSAGPDRVMWTDDDLVTK